MKVTFLTLINMKYKALVYTLYVLFLVLLSIFIGVKPYYNMDMLPYMAIILKFDKKLSEENTHSKVYSEIKEKLPASDFALLTVSTDYRKSLYTDEAAFDEQLAFYYIKPLYLFCAFLFYQSGFNLLFSTVLPSLLSYFFIGLLVLKWFDKLLPSPWLALWCCLFFLTLEPTITLGKSSAPDAMSTLFLLLGSYLLIERKSLGSSTAVFVLCILTRPDNIIFIILIYLIIALRKWYTTVVPGKLIVCFLLFFLAYFVPKLYVAHVSWSTLFYHAFVDRLLYPLSNPATLSATDYFTTLAKSSIHSTFFAKTFLLLLALFAGFTCWNRRNFLNLRQESASFNQFFMLAIVTAVCVRFLLFPAFLDRFIAPFLLLSAIIFVKECYPDIHGKLQQRKPYRVSKDYDPVSSPT